MYIIFKDTEKAKEKIQQLQKLDPTTQVNKNTINVVVKTSEQILCVVQVSPERQVKCWKAGNPNNAIRINFQDLVSVQDIKGVSL